MHHKLSGKIRLDRMLFEKGLAESRERAKALILSGNVYVNDVQIDKAGTLVNSADAITIKKPLPYVSRGGLKLQEAINAFHINVRNYTAADVGASTGGFTDCLLQNGAAKVYAIDVGYGQFSWKLRNDSRVTLFEKTNIRYMDPGLIHDDIDIAVIDVSFISLTKVLPAVLALPGPCKEIVTLIKPQFEAGRAEVGKGGVVRDERVRQKVICRVREFAECSGLSCEGITESPIKGPKGNVEFLMYLKGPVKP